MMRHFMPWAVVGGVLFIGGEVRADAYLGNLFGAGNPRERQYQQVDMSNIAAPIPSSGSSVTLGGILSKLGIPGLKTQPSPVNLPAPVFPSTGPVPAPVIPKAFQPVQPIIPGR